MFLVLVDAQDGCGDDYYSWETQFATHERSLQITDLPSPVTSSKNSCRRMHHTCRASSPIIQAWNQTDFWRFYSGSSLKYRIAPHTTTGVPPEELLMGRRLQFRLNLLYPELSQKVQSQQLKQKRSHDNTKTLRSIQVRDLVFAENFSDSSPKWLAGNVLKTTGPLSYEVELQSGIMVRRHIDNIRGRKSPSSPLSDEDQPEADSSSQTDPAADSSSQTDPAADDLVDPLDLPTDPVIPPETSGVLPMPSPTNPPAPETQDPPPPRQDPPPPPPPPPHHAGESEYSKVFTTQGQAWLFMSLINHL